MNTFSSLNDGDRQSRRYEIFAVKVTVETHSSMRERLNNAIKKLINGTIHQTGDKMAG